MSVDKGFQVIRLLLFSFSFGLERSSREPRLVELDFGNTFVFFFNLRFVFGFVFVHKVDAKLDSRGNNFDSSAISSNLHRCVENRLAKARSNVNKGVIGSQSVLFFLVLHELFVLGFKELVDILKYIEELKHRTLCNFSISNLSGGVCFPVEPLDFFRLVSFLVQFHVIRIFADKVISIAPLDFPPFWPDKSIIVAPQQVGARVDLVINLSEFLLELLSQRIFFVAYRRLSGVVFAFDRSLFGAQLALAHFNNFKNNFTINCLLLWLIKLIASIQN